MTGQPLTFDATPEELQLFMSEGEEQLEWLSQGVLQLEQTGDDNAERLQAIFRAAHTLKGSSGAIGHQRLARLTHGLESVLDQVRHHQLSVTTDLVDLLLQCLDALRVLLDEVATGVASDIALEDLYAGLDALARGATAGAGHVPALNGQGTGEADRAVLVAPGDVRAELGLWRVEVAIAGDSPLPAPRALQAVIACRAVGTVFETQPGQDDIEAGRVDAGAHIVIWVQADGPTDAAAPLSQRLGRIPEIAVVGITPPTGPALGLLSAESPSAESPSAESAPEGAGQWRIAVQIAPDCPLPAVRALQIVLAADTVGTIVDCNPARTAIDAGLVAEGATVTLTLAPRDAGTVAADLRRALGRILEVTLLAPGPLDAAPPVPVPVAPAPPAAGLANAANHSAASAGKASDGEPAHPVLAPRMVRVDVERLDALMNLIGELVISRTRLARLCTQLGGHTAEATLVEDLTESCRHIVRISDDLQDQVMRARMQPIEAVFSKFPRLLRDLAHQIEKKIEFVVEGQDTELDRSVAEQIGDPLIHLLRNAIDHGIESPADRRRAGKAEAGLIRLAARHEENQIVIDVEDDGRGIDPDALRAKAAAKGLLSAESAARLTDREALELIFASGFSTAERISDISGRGVGMDIVRTNIERLNGSVTVETEVGQGSRFTIRLPLTLAIIRALLVEIAGQTYAIPLSAVVEALRVSPEELRAINGHEAIELRGQVVPLLRLAELFGVPAPAGAQRQFVVAARWGDKQGGLVVDALIGEQEIVIKPLGQVFRAVRGIAGGAVLGDGQVAPILDVAALINNVVGTERMALSGRGATA